MLHSLKTEAIMTQVKLSIEINRKTEKLVMFLHFQEKVWTTEIKTNYGISHKIKYL